jgi:hypothetical protein
LLKAKRIFLIVSIPNISWCPPKETFSLRKTFVQGGSFLHAHHTLNWVTFTCRSTTCLSRYAIWANTVRDNITEAIALQENGNEDEAKRLLIRAANSLSSFSEVQSHFDPNS